MFETIVWATDGSELADRALPTVISLARAHRSKIVAVHANELLRGRFGGAPLYADEPDLLQKIKGQVAELRELGFTVELKVARGSTEIPALVARAALDVDADLIVVGTHGHGGVKAAVLGSVARGLLHTACCPILAIPPERRALEAQREPEAAGVA